MPAKAVAESGGPSIPVPGHSFVLLSGTVLQGPGQGTEPAKDTSHFQGEQQFALTSW